MINNFTIQTYKLYRIIILHNLDKLTNNSYAVGLALASTLSNCFMIGINRAYSALYFSGKLYVPFSIF